MIARKVVLGVLTLSLGGVVVSQADPPPTPPPATPPAIAPAGAPAPADPNAPSPKIEFATPIHEFGKIKSGDVVKYTYWFTNTGNAVLEIQGVRPSCGCTTAGDFSKKVEPGQAGSIPIQFNSGNFNGNVFKTITVTSTAKNSPSMALQLKGTIWKPIEFSPAYSVLNIPPDAASAFTKVHITNNLEEPLFLLEPTSSNPSFSAEIVTNSPGKGYELTITAKRPLNTGTMNGQITIKTLSTNTPTVTVPFWANVQSSVMIFPAQVTLPPAPLTNKVSPTVTIQNNSTNHLSVTEAEVNVPGVELELKEMQPGKLFSAQLVFPPGFQVPVGKQVFFTAKSSSTEMPVIKVPILQQTRPAAPPALPASPAAGANGSRAQASQASQSTK
jgi:hypothetical protein